jgi:ATP-dependent RNA helicase RhlE
MTQSFSELSLSPAIERAVAEMGYETMTPIQAQAIPVVLQGRDVMGAAQTGTGKTAAFTLPLLQRMLKHENASTSPARHPVRALVLLPTRELADQVADQVKLYAKYTNLRSTVVFGGMDMKPQTAELKKGVEVLVATPGRLLDHIEAKNCVLNQVEYVVLDEADRMLDIGFLPDLQRILSYLPKQRTTLLFSATFSPEIKRLASSYLQDPVTIEVARSNATASTVEQHFYRVEDDDKRAVLKQILRERGLKQAFVFVNSKLGCARLARSLEREGLNTTALHGDKSQDERLKALDAFKTGAVDLLVCTDVAARGLDIKDVPAVFNFDIPFNAEDYVHRIGRTGRAGASGRATSKSCSARSSNSKRWNSKPTAVRRAASTTASAPGRRPKAPKVPKVPKSGARAARHRAIANAPKRAAAMPRERRPPPDRRVRPAPRPIRCSTSPMSPAPRATHRPPGKWRNAPPPAAPRPTSRRAARCRPVQERARARAGAGRLTPCPTLPGGPGRLSAGQACWPARSAPRSAPPGRARR